LFFANLLFHVVFAKHGLYPTLSDSYNPQGYGFFPAVLVAARTGQLLNMAELGNEIGIAGPTVKRWLSALKTSQLIRLLPPYHKNFGKRLRKSPQATQNFL